VGLKGLCGSHGLARANGNVIVECPRAKVETAEDEKHLPVHPIDGCKRWLWIGVVDAGWLPTPSKSVLTYPLGCVPIMKRAIHTNRAGVGLQIDFEHWSCDHTGLTISLVALPNIR
jgi:hypothetical protein